MAGDTRSPQQHFDANKARIEELRGRLEEGAASLGEAGRHAYVEPQNASGLNAIADDRVFIRLKCDLGPRVTPSLTYETSLGSKGITRITEWREYDGEKVETATGELSNEMVDEQVVAFVAGVFRRS